VRHDGSEPVLFGNHVSIQGGHESGSSTGHLVNDFETIVEITSLEVMRHAWKLRPTSVGHVRVGRIECLNALSQLGRVGIIENDYSESVWWIVNVACCAGSVHDKVDVLAAACDENIDGRYIVADKP